MITFAYKARDTNGKVVTGTQTALDEESAMTSLMGQGLLVLSLEKKRTQKGNTTHKVKLMDLVLFTRQLATMVSAGLPLVQALDALHDTADPKRQRGLRAVIGDVRQRVAGGETLTESLRKHPRVFNQLYIAMIKAGESAGMLDTILDRLAIFLEEAARLVRKVRSAMIYPVAVLTIAFLITAFLLIKVVPVFDEIYSEFDSALPGPTLLLVNLSEMLQASWVYVGMAMIAGIFLFRYYINTTRGRKVWDRTKLKFPIFGPLLYKIAMTRFARTFAQLIRSGVPVLEAIDIVGDTSGNTIITDAMTGVRKNIEDGDPISSALGKDKIFPPMLIRMVTAGEETGEMEEMLDKISDFWDEEIEATLDGLTSLMQPLLICLIGGIVGTIVVCMFLPIFKLHEVISE